MRYRAILLCAAITLLSVSFRLNAQTGAADGSGRQVQAPLAVVYVQDLTPSEMGDRIRDILKTRVAEKLESYHLRLVAEPVLVDTPDTGEADIRIQPLLAQSLPPEADLVVASVFRIRQTAVDIQFILLDPKQKTVLGGVLSRARTGLTVFTSVDAAVNDLDPVLEQYVSNRYQYKPPEGVVEKITLRGGVEGAQVFFAGRDVGRVSEGALNVPYTPFPVGSRVRVDIRKEGYHPRQAVIDLPGTQVESSIPALQRESRFGLGINWAFGEALGFGVSGRLYAIPDWTYIQLDHYRHMTPADKPGFRDLRHYDFGISAGQYLFLSYDSLVRVAVTLGVGIIYTSPADFSGPDFSDVYLSIVSPSVELNLHGWHFYVQPQLKFTLGLGDNLLGRSWLATSIGIPPVTLGVIRTW
ncbi:hypothetical protein [Salinispira pacifica]